MLQSLVSACTPYVFIGQGYNRFDIHIGGILLSYRSFHWVLILFAIPFALSGAEPFGDFGFVQNSIKGLDANTLVQVLSMTDSKVKLQIFKQNDTSWTGVRIIEISPTQWKKLRAVTAKVAPKNELEVQRRDGKFYPVYLGTNQIVCKPVGPVTRLGGETNEILSAAEERINPKLLKSVEISPKRAAPTENSKLGRQIFLANWLESWAWSSKRTDKAREMNTRAELAQRKHEFIVSLQKLIKNKTISDQDANNFLTAMTLFGEFRSPRNPAPVFWTMKVLEERAKRFDVRNTSIYLDDLPPSQGGEIISWQAKTRAGAALAKNQFSSWKVMTSNNTLRTMLNPAREGQAGQTGFREMLRFLLQYDVQRYEIVGEDPHIAHYDSPTAYHTRTELTKMGYKAAVKDLQARAPFLEVPIRMPKIRDRLTKVEYEDWMTFIGGE